MVDPAIPEEQTTDRLTALDRELTQSIERFDADLLAALDAIRRRSADRMQDLENEAAAAARRLEARGVDLGVAGSGAADPSGETTAEKRGGPQSRETQLRLAHSAQLVAPRYACRSNRRGQCNWSSHACCQSGLPFLHPSSSDPLPISSPAVRASQQPWCKRKRKCSSGCR